MAKKPDLSDYVDVAERIAEFYAKYPEGSIQTIEGPTYSTFSVEEGGGMDAQTGQLIPPRLVQKVVVICKAAAFRHPEDQRPGIGSAAEPVPGRTPYTRDSEAQNAETSAWGRAIVACGFSTKKIASRQEVVNRLPEAEQQAALDDGWAAAAPAPVAPVSPPADIPAPAVSPPADWPEPDGLDESVPASGPDEALPTESEPVDEPDPTVEEAYPDEIDLVDRLATWIRGSGVPMTTVQMELARMSVPIVNKDMGDTLRTMTPTQASQLENFVRSERARARRVEA